MAHTDHGDPRDDKNLIQDLEVGEENSSVSQEREINLDDLEAEYGHFKAAEGNRYNDGDNLVATQSPYDKLAVEVGGPLAAFTSESSPLLNIPSFNESVVTVGEYYHKNIGSNVSLTSFLGYVKSLFPIINWLPHYNIPWLYADVVAGVTVGCVLVPQSMSYAQLASLSSEYGLYSSFVGAFIYSFFATSKDVCIGPVAVMSLQVGKVIHEVKKNLPEDTKITGPIIATALALLCGTITTGIGLLRLGFLVELISLNAVAGFMTGSALSIISGQVPALMGYGKHVDTRESTYKVIISDLKHLKDTNINAVFGLLPLAILFAWKWGCAVGPRVVNKYLPAGSKKAQTWKAAFFYAQALRNAVVIILFTAISYAVTRNDGKKPRLALLGVVPSGLKHVGTPKLPDNVLSRLTPELPASVIVLLLEHIAISKSFARINNYVVVPDQELIAIGVTNLIATLFNAYPATGSFSRSALKAKCNVKTPLSGLFTGACVLLALYCLTDAFYYIPKATLSAVVIHAVADLVSSPKTALIFWRANPLDCFAFLATVIITVFDTIEHGIYFSVAWSAAVLIVKICFSNGNFLGYVKVAEVLNPNVVPCQYTYEETESLTISDGQVKDKAFSSANELSAVSNGSHSADKPPTIHYYLKWVPLDNRYFRELNPDVPVHPPPPGIIVYRPTDSWVYINTSRHFDMIYSKVKELTRPGALVNHLSKRDRPWNDPGEWRPPSFIARLLKKTYDDDNSQKRDTRPILRVLAMDWSQVVQIDSTGVQSLVDLRNTINRYANRQVEFHFSGIVSPWIKRALINAGFGTISKDYADNSHPLEHASYHIINSSPNNEDNRESSSSESHLYTALGTNTPFFHLDMPDFTKWDP